MKKGILFGIGAHTLWGFFLVYWKLLHGIPALQLLGHRIIWSFLLLMVVLLVTRQRGDFRRNFNLRTILIYTIAALLIGGNWLTYVCAVNANLVVETSLGYFINPLLSVLLGVIILREKLRPFQWIPILLAFTGVIYLTVIYGKLPWIALTLAFTFGTYGFVKKKASLGALQGLTLETGVLVLPALAYLLLMQRQGTGAFGQVNTFENTLLVVSGIITAIPLLLFADAARRIPLSMMGIIQFLSPTLQFLLGVLVYGEAFSGARIVGFSLIWLALILYTCEGFYFRNRALRSAAAPV